MSTPFLNKVSKPAVAGPLALLVVVLLVFGDLLTASGSTVISAPGTDVASLFLFWREWGFGQLRAGNLPLWNPHIAGGHPFFGGFQSSLLYPLNWIYLFLPLTRAINLDVVLHVYLVGVFFYFWALRRGLHPLSSAISATCVMLGGPFFLHVYAGHLSPLAVMAWAPLVLMSADALLQRPTLRWTLIGAWAVAMQILAGYPQMFFYTAVALALMTPFGLWRQRREAVFKPLHSVLALTGVYALGASLAMVQLLTGLDAAKESVRGGGVSFALASMFSFPPENLVTLLAPRFFGDMSHFPYWGRCYLWEMCLFAGVSSLSVAVYGLFAATGQQRRWAWSSLVLALALFVLALGAHTPLFAPLYEHVPGFNNFRSNSKFIFPAALFGAMMVGIGFDCLIRRMRSAPENDASEHRAQARDTHRIAIGMAASSVAVALLALWIPFSAAQGTGGLWGKWLALLPLTGESYYQDANYLLPGFLRDAGRFAANSLWVAAGVGLLSAAILGLRQRSHMKPYALATVALLELLWFAHSFRPTFNLEAVHTRGLRALRQQHSGPGRYAKLGSDYSADSSGYNLGGYDPYLLKRYAEFVVWTQGGDPNSADAYLTIRRYDPLLQMLRWHYVFAPQGNEMRVGELNDPFPQLFLVPNHEVVKGRDNIFAAMRGADFNPRRTVILESEPQIKPPSGNAKPGTVRLLQSDSDSLTIEANLTSPQILLITDAYSRHWRAVALSESSQQSYELLPANYTLRAVPLAAGKHRLRIEYAPAAFRIGSAISIAALLLFAIACVWCVRGRIRDRNLGARTGGTD